MKIPPLFVIPFFQVFKVFSYPPSLVRPCFLGWSCSRVCVWFMQQGIKFIEGFTHSKYVLLVPNIPSAKHSNHNLHTYTHKWHTQRSIDHIYKYILTPPVICSQQLYMTELITHWYRKLILHSGLQCFCFWKITYISYVLPN